MIDFGIAKALSMELTRRTLFTGLGQMIGTPQYMNPEQAEVNALDVDTRSDSGRRGEAEATGSGGLEPPFGSNRSSACQNECLRRDGKLRP